MRRGSNDPPTAQKRLMQMQQMTKEAIKTLQKKTNHALSVEDCDLIEELDAIANGFAGVTKSERRLLSTPFELCGIKFYPLTVAKSLWYTEKCEEWEVEGSKQDGLLFWLLSLPNTEAELDTYSEQKRADKAVKKLGRQLHCTQREMTDVYHKCLGVNSTGDKQTHVDEAVAMVVVALLSEEEEKAISSLKKLSEKLKEKAKEDTDYGGMVAVLLREYGGTPDEWLYETPIEMISALFKAYSDKVNAENDAGRKASASKGKAVAPPPSKKLAALAKFREKVKQIEQVWRGEP